MYADLSAEPDYRLSDFAIRLDSKYRVSAKATGKRFIIIFDFINMTQRETIGSQRVYLNNNSHDSANFMVHRVPPGRSKLALTSAICQMPIFFDAV